MSKELTFFKFKPSSWIFGRIQRRSDAAKVAFMNLMCKYWHDGCEMSIEEAELDFGADQIQELLSNKIIKSDGQNIRISFLDEQLHDIKLISQIKSGAGKESARRRAGKTQPVEQTPKSEPITPEERIENDQKDMSLVDVFFKDFPNSSYLNNVQSATKMDRDALLAALPLFRSHCSLSYPRGMLEFANHFKNWVLKRKTQGASAPIPDPGKTTMKFGPKHRPRQ